MQLDADAKAAVVSGRQRYKIWEQFTTPHAAIVAIPRLFQDDKDTKFESNSQQRNVGNYQGLCCFRTTKIQNLRAIHNNLSWWFFILSVVSGRQRYKIWEQFTTAAVRPLMRSLLFQDDKDTKFESNSQQEYRSAVDRVRCFRTTKIQNLRAIHNGYNTDNTYILVVSGRQRYKIWEQFTTALWRLFIRWLLFQDDKDTKFESNSQPPTQVYVSDIELFQDDKDTKFESNSQQTAGYPTAAICCFRTTKIQNLRAIHNCPCAAAGRPGVVSGRQRYKIWEQFTTWKPPILGTFFLTLCKKAQCSAGGGRA